MLGLTMKQVAGVAIIALAINMIAGRMMAPKGN